MKKAIKRFAYRAYVVLWLPAIIFLGVICAVIDTLDGAWQGLNHGDCNQFIETFAMAIDRIKAGEPA